MRWIGVVAALCVGAVVMSGCSNSGKGNARTTVDGASFTFAVDSDPGNLDPQASADAGVQQLDLFGYDPLVHVDAGGGIAAGLATSWKTAGNQVQLTLRKNVTCSDGSAFTAADAAANLNWVADPKNKSPLLGAYVPAGAHATADAAAGSVTMTAPRIGSFVLNGLAHLSMVCAKGMHDRKLLAQGMDGTGPYTLTRVAANNQYTFTKRTGYTWGPAGASTAVKGIPAKVVAKVVPNATTAANLLLTGGLNAATVIGPDAKRLTAQKLFAADMPLLAGEMWFNQAKGRPGADLSVRKALTGALDLGQLAKVLTSGTGTPATALASVAPVACPATSLAGTLPEHDLDQAEQLLDQAGWTVGSGGIRAKDGKPLALTLLYNTALGTGVSAAAELAAQVWKQLGVKITTKAQDNSAATSTLFGTGDWDIAWDGVNVSSPDQLVPFTSGAVPPAGSNFAHIDNAAYDSGVAAAANVQGSASCADWTKAGASLVSDLDVVPFANEVIQTFGKGARFEFQGDLIPTSIRMQAG